MQKILGLMAGAGGFGGEVLSWLNKAQSSNKFDQVLLIDDSLDILSKKEVYGHPVVSFDEFCAIKDSELFYNVLVGDPNTRRKIWQRFKEKNIETVSLKAPTSDINDIAEIDKGSVFCQNTIVTSNAKIGVSFQCNIYSYVAHDCVIGDFVTFAPRVCCNGNVHIEDNVYIGTNAVIKQGTPDKPLVIGKGAIIGMGAVVCKDVEPNEIVVGNPAKVLSK